MNGVQNSDKILGTWIILDEYGNENILEVSREYWTFTYHSPTDENKTTWETKSWSSPYKFIKKNKIRIEHHPQEIQYIVIFELTDVKLVVKSSGDKKMNRSKKWTYKRK